MRDIITQLPEFADNFAHRGYAYAGRSYIAQDCKVIATMEAVFIPDLMFKFDNCALHLLPRRLRR